MRKYNGSLTNSRVLVLNQGYEPVTICSTKKAVLLLFLTKAELVEEREDKYIRSVSRCFPFPSVIRLSNYIKVPYKKIELSRKNVLRRDENRCQYCGKRDIEMTIDHIIPKSRGGTDSWENLVTACKHCNNKKGNRTPEEANMKLIKMPRKPNHILFIRQNVGKIEDKWKPFLFME
ncbi:MAG TPA: HNH endonuclease [Candidatus Kapabacteria bacterium]|nr:HNH endonuclease [Candidatus Kapabacteria bacterium]